MTAGDEAAYREFYELYYNRLWRYLLVVASGNEGAAREALQGMLIRFVRNVRVFRDKDVFWSWLTVLARSSFLDEKRKQKRYLAFLDRFIRHARSESDSRAGDRLGEILTSQLSALTHDERHLIEQKYFEHLSVRTIAEQMNITEKAVESSLVRIRRKLKHSVLSELTRERHP